MHNDKINLLHLVTGLGVGGAERVVLDLASSADKEKFEVSVVSLSERDELKARFEEKKIQLTILNKKNGIKDLIEMILFLHRYVNSRNIEIIHTHMTHAMMVASIVKIFNPKLKIVFTSHSINVGSKLRKMMIYFLKFLRNKDILFSLEQKSLIYRDDFVIIPNGIDIDAYAHTTKKYDKFTILSVGRLEKVKNHKALLQSARYLKKHHIDFNIKIAGEGDQRVLLEAYIEKHQLNDCVELLGLCSDVAGLMSKAHLFALTSLWEGLPMVLLEAGASSLPIVTTAVGSIPSLINNENGFLLQDIDELDGTLLDIIKNYTEAEKKASRVYKNIVKQYGLENIVTEHQMLYKSLCVS